MKIDEKNEIKGGKSEREFVVVSHFFVFEGGRELTVYGGGIPSTISSRSRSILSFVAIDGSELDLTSCGKLPSDSDVDDGPGGPRSKSDSGLEA